MIVIKKPHALKVSFVTVMVKARHPRVSWRSCVAVFVCVPSLFCFHQWVSLSLMLVALGIYFCWSLTLCPRHTHTQMHTRTQVHTHTQVHTQCSHAHRFICTHTRGHIHSAHTGAHAHMGTQFLPGLPSLSLSLPFFLCILPFLLLQMSAFNVLLDPPLLKLRKPFFWTLRNIYSRNHTGNDQEKKSANSEKGQHW